MPEYDLFWIAIRLACSKSAIECQTRSRKGNNSDEPIPAMQKLFPGQSEVFSYWVNGMLKIQSGEIIEYFHDVYESFYEKDIFLKFENEILIEENTINNTLKE